MRHIHFVDNASDIAQKTKDSPDYDKLYKIRDLLNLIKRNTKGALNLERNIAIDETLVKFKGRVSFRHFLPNKSRRFDVKNFTLSESSSGYVWDLDVYTGKSGHDPHKGLAHHVVRKLVQDFEGKGFNLFVDNWYSSPQLFEELAEEKILACGTVRANRKGLPKDIMNVKAKEIKSMKRGQSVFRQKGRLTACTWKDSKFVHLLTTMPTTTECSEVSRSVKEKDKWVQKKVQRPAVVELYNKYMGGVDLADQRVRSYQRSTKCWVWYMKLFFYLVEVAIMNAYILERKSPHHNPPVTSKSCLMFAFRLELVEKLIGGRVYRKRQQQNQPQTGAEENGSTCNLAISLLYFPPGLTAKCICSV